MGNAEGAVRSVDSRRIWPSRRQCLGRESDLGVVAVKHGKDGLEEDVAVNGEAQSLVALEAAVAR